MTLYHPPPRPGSSILDSRRDENLEEEVQGKGFLGSRHVARATALTCDLGGGSWVTEMWP